MKRVSTLTVYTYDWNGNLLFLQRKNQFGEDMHQVDYNYPSNSNNRLGGIAATGLQSGTYQYDALGNLVCDNAEGLTVSWNALGKVDTIQKNGLLLTRFQYSPTGQRQVKASLSDTIYYIHDATGNVMCIYRFKGDTLTATERYIYGNKRLGVLGQQVWITAGGIARLQDTNTIGQRTYELTDHLGNVTATILDRKQFVYYSGNVPISVPYTVTYTDYYPFGFPMPGRSYYNGGYRYFFNGQEADNEVLGEGGLAGYEFREYDTRLGRWWGVDRKAAKYPSLSPYQFCAGNPIWMKDVDGSDFVVVIDNSGDNKTITVQMNIYTSSREAYEKLLPAVEEIESITKKVTIDDVEYTIIFNINPITPEETALLADNNNIQGDNNNCRTLEVARNDGAFGNAFLGSIERDESHINKDGKLEIVAGKTYIGKNAQMYIWKDYRFIDYPELIAHEILHMLGLDDNGGIYYSPEGRMMYAANPANNFAMNPISNEDIRNIICYMLENNNLGVTPNVKIKYINNSVPIDPNSNIDVQ